MSKALNILATLALVFLSLTSVVAAEQQKEGTLRHFVSLPTGLSAEGIAIHNGHFYVGTFSFAASDGTILVLNEDGFITGRFTVTGLPQVGQIAFVGDETLFAVAGNIATGKGAVVKVDLASEDVTVIASGFRLPNGIAVDDRGNLYVTDVLAGTVSKITPDGMVSLFASGPLLEPDLVKQVNLQLGPNDLAIDKKESALYVTNIGKETVVKIEFKKDGTAGDMTNFAKVPTPDGLAFDVRGNLYVTSPFTDTIWTVATDGTVHQFAPNTSHETLSNPSNVAFHGSLLYITNLGLTEGSTKISVVRVELPGLPLA